MPIVNHFKIEVEFQTKISFDRHTNFIETRSSMYIRFF